ncbi:MAG: ABC transporter ATP-binding protein [Solirubrobacteraceae bacterium]
MVTAESAITVRGLVKRYGQFEAVRGIDLDIRRGEVFAFLGPNGAGKTTTVEILEGYRPRTGGEVSVLGVDPATGGRAWRSRIGIVLQTGEVTRELTVRETLRLWAAYQPEPRGVDEVIDLVGLSEKADDRIGRLSGGQRRRVEVGMALVGNPELVFLDEPTTGFDPEARRQFWGVISGLRDLGTTIFLTTHYMDEAQALADRVAIVKDGQIVAEGPPGELGPDRDRAAVINFVLPSGTGAADLPAALPGPTSVNGHRVTVRTERPTAALGALAAWAAAHGGELPELTVARPSLEDVYLELTTPAGGGAGAP